MSKPRKYPAPTRRYRAVDYGYKPPRTRVEGVREIDDLYPVHYCGFCGHEACQGHRCETHNPFLAEFGVE